MWSYLCQDEFTYFEGWCYSLRKESDFVEADCDELNATMVNKPNYKENYFVAGNLNNVADKIGLLTKNIIFFVTI